MMGEVWCSGPILANENSHMNTFFAIPFSDPLTIPNPNITLIFGKIRHHWPCPSTTLGN